MRRRFQAPLVVVLAFLPILSATRAYADLECSEPLVEKGEVHSGVPLSHRFTILNKGPETIDITEVRPSCGCLAPQMSQRHLQPGQKSELVLEVNTLTQPAGENNWRITLRYKIGDGERELPLYIRARIVTEISVEPPSLAIYTDSPISHEITVVDRRVEPLMVRAVPTSSPQVRTHLGELHRDEAGHWRRSIRVEVLADCPAGTHDETLRICTSDPLYAELKVPFTIVKRPHLHVNANPASVVLTAPAQEALPARVVLLSAAEDRAVQIERIEADNAAIDCRWAQGPGTQATLKIRVDRSRIPGDRLRGYVHVHLSKPASETITIPVSFLLH
jgi:hypothetical protein